MLEYYRTQFRRLPILDLDNKGPRFPEIPIGDYLMRLDLFAITAVPEKIQYTLPWIFIDNQPYTPLRLSAQPSYLQRATIEFVTKHYPDIDVEESSQDYYYRMGVIQAGAGRNGLNFQVNNMTDTPRGHHYLENYFQIIPLGELLTEIRTSMHRVPNDKEIPPPTITRIAYGVPIDYLLSDHRGLMPTLFDKAKLALQRARRKVVLCKRCPPGSFRSIDINHSDHTTISPHLWTLPHIYNNESYLQKPQLILPRGRSPVPRGKVKVNTSPPASPSKKAERRRREKLRENSPVLKSV